MVFLLGLDGGLPGNNQSQQRLEADPVAHIGKQHVKRIKCAPDNTQILSMTFPCSLARTDEFADLALNQCDPVRSELFGERSAREGRVKGHTTGLGDAEVTQRNVCLSFG